MFKCDIPLASTLLDIVPREDLPQDEEKEKFWKAVAIELRDLIDYASKLKESEVCFTAGRKAGSQYIWEFWVNDLTRENKPSQMNWHGQNTSQWVYAGAIMLQNGRVSMHH